MGHTNCGGVRASLENTSHGLIDLWLRNIKDVQRLHRAELERCLTPEEKCNKLVELNVREQVLNLCKTATVQGAWAQGQTVALHGLVCDLNSGLIKELELTYEDWQGLEGIYGIDFPLLHSDRSKTLRRRGVSMQNRLSRSSSSSPRQTRPSMSIDAAELAPLMLDAKHVEVVAHAIDPSVVPTIEEERTVASSSGSVGESPKTPPLKFDK